MTTEEFEKLVSEALENLPAYFKEKLDNVEVVVADWPTQDMARGRLLLGLYQGVPKTTYGKSYAVLPDKITIFKGPIELLSRGDEKVLKNLIIDTVKHEIAHHFGISDNRIDEIKKGT